MNVTMIIGKCEALGGRLSACNDHLVVEAPQPLPDELIAELKEAKPFILAELQRKSKSESDCHLLEIWRQLSIPDWRRIRQESIETGNVNREEYARWMLKEILQDDESTEEL